MTPTLCHQTGSSPSSQLSSELAASLSHSLALNTAGFHELRGLSGADSRGFITSLFLVTTCTSSVWEGAEPESSHTSGPLHWG